MTITSTQEDLGVSAVALTAAPAAFEAAVARCQCGCGEPAPLATRSGRNGVRRGEPQAYIRGHNTRIRPRIEACQVSGCARPHQARGYCKRHWVEFRQSSEFVRRQSPRPRKAFVADSAYYVRRLNRLLDRVSTNEDGCWVFQGTKNAITGYGVMWVHPTQVLTHRFLYEWLCGPIPAGLQIDHLCRNRACCNPFHLEPVTPEVNLQRGRDFRQKGISMFPTVDLLVDETRMDRFVNNLTTGDGSLQDIASILYLAARMEIDPIRWRSICGLMSSWCARLSADVRCAPADELAAVVADARQDCGAAHLGCTEQVLGWTFDGTYCSPRCARDDGRTRS